VDFAYPHRVHQREVSRLVERLADVLPNAMLAVYYSWRGQPETVYASQVGDAHVSIPLCLGVYALYHTMVMPPFFHAAMFILLGATLVHLSSWRCWGGCRSLRAGRWCGLRIFPVEGIAGMKN